MNIFVVNRDPVRAARDLCDKHVVKMVLETAQILCTLFEPGTAPYRRTHYNHPCCVWVRQSRQHVEWVLAHGFALSEEYTRRYGKVHKSTQVLEWVKANYAELDLPTGWSDPPACVPDACKQEDVVASYRNYYLIEKRYMARWAYTDPPAWWRSE